MRMSEPEIREMCHKVMEALKPYCDAGKIIGYRLILAATGETNDTGVDVFPITTGLSINLEVGELLLNPEFGAQADKHAGLVVDKKDAN